MRRVVIVCVVACLASALAGSSSFAAGTHKHVYKTRTTVKAANDLIQGTLSSAKKACLGHRGVRAQLIVLGSRPIPLGNVRSDGNGVWKYHYKTAEVPPRAAIQMVVGPKELSSTALCAGLYAKRVISR